MKMPNIIVVGTQWGDEGKGKVIDILSEKASHVVRAQGGNNAGHTIIVENVEYKFHLIPSGILYPNVRCYLGGGTVIDPEKIKEEIDSLESQGVSVKKRIFISPHAHVILSVHRKIDALQEKAKGKNAIGTTGKGIGPAYTDKASRIGIKMGEFVRPDILRKRLTSFLTIKNKELTALYGDEAIVLEDLMNHYALYAEFLTPYVADVETKLATAIQAKESILFEGAHGTLLDINFGSYPYVTSSNTISAGVCCGAGVGPTKIDYTVGVLKAYNTRVGNGPFPTEFKEEEYNQFLDNKTAREIGTTTGRNRRMGWFDAVLGKYSMNLNGIDFLAITKLDVLDTLSEIKICTHYLFKGEKVHTPPAVWEDLDEVEPVYEVLPGWRSSTRDIQRFEELPPNAQNYIKRIESLLRTPIAMVSTGPEREKTLILNHLLG